MLCLLIEVNCYAVWSDTTKCIYTSFADATKRLTFCDIHWSIINCEQSRSAKREHKKRGPALFKLSLTIQQIMEIFGFLSFHFLSSCKPINWHDYNALFSAKTVTPRSVRSSCSSTSWQWNGVQKQTERESAIDCVSCSIYALKDARC